MPPCPALDGAPGTSRPQFSTFHAHFPQTRLRRFGRSGDGKKLQIPGGLFQRCPECGAVLHKIELEENQRVCPHCEHHFRIGSRERLRHLLDPDTFQEPDADLEPVDMLNFRAADSLPRPPRQLPEKDRPEGFRHQRPRARSKGREVAVSILDFAFLGGTLGSVAGEKITRNIETATERGLPAISISAAGGARLHEGMFALMQMAKTSGALAFHAQARLPFISILTDPTYGGVTASFAALGDVILAEPKAMIGFAGPRVIQDTTRQELAARFPDGRVPRSARPDRHDRQPQEDARDAGEFARVFVSGADARLKTDAERRLAPNRSTWYRSTDERGTNQTPDRGTFA